VTPLDPLLISARFNLAQSHPGVQLVCLYVTMIRRGNKGARFVNNALESGETYKRIRFHEFMRYWLRFSTHNWKSIQKYECMYKKYGKYSL